MNEHYEVDLQELGLDQVYFEAFEFGGETRDVNALRARSLWCHGSVRLLADLITVTKGDEPGLQSDRNLVARARPASPVLLRSLRPDKRSATYEAPKPHRVWVTKHERSGAPLEALTHLLSHSITVQFDEPTAVVTFSNSRLQVHWHYPRKKEAELPAFGSLAELDGLTNLPFCHLFFVAPADGKPESVLGDPLPGCFHRIVYLTEHLPKAMPNKLFPLLHPAVKRRLVVWRDEGGAHFKWTGKDEGPFFSSFVASLTKKPRHETFGTKPVDQEFDSRNDPPEHPGWRIERDHCRIWFDLKLVEEAWQKLSKEPAKFVATLLKESAVKETAFRWARAVTNRSLGVALSGGGASSYALVPLLRRLEKKHVPIDVLSGVSGGAFLGAYYCKEGVEGLTHSISDGWLYQIGLLPNAVTSEVGRRIVDRSLGYARMGDTERRFVPVTIKLSARKSPCAHRVVSGTLGEAVQASGAAPLLFGPVTKHDEHGWSRYSDGGMAMVIPARILRNHGADIIFAFNCLSGPAESNPLARLPGGSLLYYLTPAGGVIDLWASAAYMQERLSRAVNPDAAVYYEAPPEKLPSLKSFFFAAAGAIVRQAERNRGLKAAVDECSTKWKEFSKSLPATSLARRSALNRRGVRITGDDD